MKQLDTQQLTFLKAIHDYGYVDNALHQKKLIPYLPALWPKIGVLQLLFSLAESVGKAVATSAVY